MKKKLSKNEKFWALSKPEQRVAIAKDVIKQLDAEFYKAMSGTYFESNIEVPASEVQFQKLLKKAKKEGEVCVVCAIGSCFTSAVSLGDSFKVDSDNESPYVDGIYLSAEDMRSELLNKVFSKKQQNLIEQAFEGVDNNWADDADFVDCTVSSATAIAFGEKYRDVTERLRAIMENIIKNKGTFKP